MRAAFLAVTVAVVLAVAGCGGGDDTATEPTETTTATQAKERAAEVAAAIGLHFFDFPPGWNQTRGEDKDETTPEEKALDDEFEPRFAACALGTGSPVSDDDNAVGEAEAEFESADDSSVESTVEVYATEKEAEAAFDVEALKTGLQCARPIMQEYFTRRFALGGGLPPGVQVGLDKLEVVDTDITDVPAGRFEMLMTVSGPGGSIPLRLVVVGMRNGRVVASLSFFSVRQPFDTKLADKLTNDVKARLLNTVP